MSPLVALGVLSAYLLVSAEVYLATHVRGVFTMTFLGVGPTELRILLAIGVAALAWRPMVSPFGLGPFRLFDVGGVVAIAGMVVAFIVVGHPQHARALRRRAHLANRGRGAGRPRRQRGRRVGRARRPRRPSPRSTATSTPPTRGSRRSGSGRCVPLPGGSQATAVWEMVAPSHGVSIDVPDALVNHWRGRTFIPHADLRDRASRASGRSRRCCGSPTS